LAQRDCEKVERKENGIIITLKHRTLRKERLNINNNTINIQAISKQYLECWESWVLLHQIRYLNKIYINGKPIKAMEMVFNGEQILNSSDII